MMQPYYSGIVRERRVHAILRQMAPGVRNVVYTMFREAMEFYERAEKLQPPANDDRHPPMEYLCAYHHGKHSVQPDDRIATAIDLE